MIDVMLFVLQAVLFIVGTLLQKPPKVENARAKGLGDFQFPTATEDRCVPILWGTADIKGPNVIWYGDLKTQKLINKVGGGFLRSKKKVTVGYKYFIGMDLLLCYGPLDRITRLEVSDRIAFSGSVNMAAAGPGGTTMVVNSPDLLGGNEKGGGVVGTFRVFGGRPDQTRSSYLVAVAGGGDPDEIPGYVDVAHAVYEQGEVGESANIGPYVFRCSRFPNNLALGSNRHIVNGTLDNGDANPAEVLYEILTNQTWGCQIDPTRIQLSDFQAAGITLYNEGLGISRVVSSVGQGLELIQDVLRICDAVMYETTAGKFRFKLIRKDYTLGALPIFDDTNVIQVENFSRTSWNETTNHYHAGYTDRTKDFIDTGAPAIDVANFRTQNREVRYDERYPGLAHPAAATAVAERDLRQRSYPFAKVKLITNREAQTLRPGDVIRWTNTQLGVTQMVLRVLTVELGELAGGKIRVNCVEDIFGVAEQIYAQPTASAWTPVDNSAAAFVTELVRSCPRILLNLSFYTEGEGDPALGERIHSMALAPKGAVSAFEQYVDPAAGSNYQAAYGFSDGVTPSATLVNSYTGATADIEASNLLVLQNLVGLTQLTAASATLIAQGLNLALLQGATEDADEIIGWESLTDLGGGQYRLGNVHRGLLDTQARTHNAGTRIWFFADGQCISDIPFINDTQSINVKHQAETTEDELSIASATARALTFSRRLKRPHHPADYKVGGTRLPVAGLKTADLAFAWEHRLNTEPSVRDANVGDTSGQDTEVEYDLEFRHLHTQAVLRSLTRTTADGADWLAYSYSAANLQSDTGQVGLFPLECRIRARYAAGATVNPANLTSKQQLVWPLQVDMGGSVVRSVDLNGTNEYLARTADQAVGITNTFTIEQWVRPRGSVSGSTAHLLTLKAGANNNNRVEIFLSDTAAGAPFSVHLYNSAGALFKDYDFGSYSVNTFTKIGIKWDGTTLTCYQDGAPVASTKNVDNAGSMTATSRRVYIGVDNTTAASFMDGLVYRTSIWNVGRTNASILADFALKATFDPRFPSANYPLTEAAGLMQHWDWRDTASIGESYGNNATLIDVLTNAANVDATDLSATVPV